LSKQIQLKKYFNANFYLTIDKKQLKSSTKEFEIMSRLTSDHVVRYFTAWIEENPTICYIQMELCFCSLRDILEQEYNEFYKMENEMINHIEYYFKSELFKEILQGVNYLHTLEKPIIHRDLKPNNILIKDSFDERQRFIKIADFGLSNFESNLNSKSFVEGCFKYMAPEILKNKKFSYETSADIYSLGQIAQEMFDIDVTE
jgi:serine/threonine protein kinase